MFRLDDKVSVVTGSAQGIGKAIALTLAEQGSAVVGTDLQEQEELQAEFEEREADFLTLEADVTDRRAIDRAIEVIDDEFGQIDILVNNAGIFPVASLESMDVEEWKKIIETNLTGTFHWTQAVLPLMKPLDQGRIVNLSSCAGGVVGWAPTLSHYAASKGGVLGFTRTAALDLARYGITVNCIAPGMIDTGAPQSVSSEEELEAAVQMTPAKRMGKPGEIATTTAFLASDEAAYITGEKIVVDGGFTKV